MRAEGQIGHDAPKLRLEQRSDPAPQSPVDEQSVREDDRWAGAGVAITEPPCGELDGLWRFGGCGHWALLLWWLRADRTQVECTRTASAPPLESIAMKAGIHPEYVLAHVRCSCGNEFYTRSTKPELHVEICSACHPFYTGKQKLVDTGGRVERFKRRAARRSRG